MDTKNFTQFVKDIANIVVLSMPKYNVNNLPDENKGFVKVVGELFDKPPNLQYENPSFGQKGFTSATLKKVKNWKRGGGYDSIVDGDDDEASEEPTTTPP